VLWVLGMLIRVGSEEAPAQVGKAFISGTV